MINAINLTLVRNHNKIINNISFVLNHKEITGVLGVNGAGKSTLLAGLSGRLTPSSGQVLLHDIPLNNWPAMERARYLAVLPQNFNLNFAFLVHEVVALGRLPHPTTQKHNKEIIAEILTLTGITHLTYRNYMQLSGGEKQRVQLARVLAQLWPITPQSVLLLDEPTAMLDPLYQHNLLKTIDYCTEQGAAVMIILHDLNLATRYCHQIVLLDKGSVFKKGTVEEVLTVEHIQQVFNLEVLIQKHPEKNYPIIIPK